MGICNKLNVITIITTFAVSTSAHILQTFKEVTKTSYTLLSKYKNLSLPV